MNYRRVRCTVRAFVLLCASTAILAACGGGSTTASTGSNNSTTLSASTIQLPSQVQVVSSK